ncbi:beta strand repeat-containing protein [Sulfurospirillum cavolei]|uniref:beta strand repeat-containing protein n=1 Tax=Sulfurospirillum cavolei TaxID=366522 RepID=UPI000764AC3E|nr:Ig-like domain-containing protein [Sulfurospirillum cavolei]
MRLSRSRQPAPTLAISASDTNLAAGESTTITFNFSETPSGFDTNDISVAGGTLSNLTQSSSDPKVWTATFTQSGTDTPSISVANESYTDLAGNKGSGATLPLNADTVAPTLAISASDTNLAAGESTTITFNFSETPSGFDTNDISVAGGTLSNLTQSSSDPKVWTATFTQSGTDTPSISVANESYTDLAGNKGSGATLPLNADTVAPTLAISASDTNLAAGESTTITFNFSETPSGFDTNDISVAGGTLSNLTQSSSDPKVWTATFTQSGTDTPSISVANESYTDLAGNKGSGATLPLNADTVAPTLAISASDTNLAAGESTTITFNFSETPSGFDTNDISVAGGTLSNLTQSSSDPKVWTATFTQSGTDTPSISVANESYTDLAGNKGSGATLPLNADTVAPTLAISASDTNLAAGESTTITFNFSETPSGFDTNDISVAGGTLSNLTQSSSDPKVWTATFTQSGTDTPSISVANESYTDLAGNKGSGATLPLNADTVAPTLAISASDTNLAAGESTTITFNFSETPSGFDTNDISVAGGTLSNLTQSSSDPKVWTATFTQSGTDTPSISVANESYTDLAGNKGSGATLPLNADTVAPTLAISASDTNLAAGESTTITFNFSETPSGFDTNDISVAGGTLSNLTQSSSDPKVWTATFTQSGTDTPSISVANESYTDLAGNKGSGATLPLNADTVAPTLAISASDTNLAAGESTTITFNFSETPSGFDTNDISVAGGTLSNLTQSSSDPKVWTATFTQSGTDTPSISVANESYTDLAGNKGSGATLPLNADTVAPTLAISASDTNLAAGESTTITFNFSETPSGFDTNDISVAGGTLSNLTQSSSDPKVWTATFTQSGTDTPSISVANESYTDLAGNKGSGATLPLNADTVAPTLAISASDTNLAAGESTTITFNFSETPSGFDTNDISVAGGTLSNLTQSSSDPKVWTATFTQSGTDTPSISVANESYTDLAGNKGSGATLIGIVFLSQKTIRI